jgi:CBS domain-containing protein
LNDLRLSLADPMMGRLLTLGDGLDFSIPRTTRPDTNLREVVHTFSSTNLAALPVFDQNHFLGLVTRDAVLAAYRSAKGQGNQ